ncbi:MAG: cell division protein FtsX [Marinilabiliales bacterium]|nr:MAG: cell division protein FtsX [Marinilabiliales bacterium]
MAGKGNKEEKISKRRLRSSYITTIVSLSLVLFLLGLIGLLILNTKKLSDYVKENIGFSVIVEDNIKEVDLIRLKKNLDASRFVKSTEHITKEKAAETLQKDLGEDFIDFLGYNPLPVSIDVRLKAPYANPDSIEVIKKELSTNKEIKELFYQPSIIDLVNKNVNRISIIILLFSALLFLISTALINNTIRLSVYSKRFTIKTMQLVGATRNFVRKPFLLTGILQGIISAIIAMMLLSGIIYIAQKEMVEIISFRDIEILGALFGIVLVIGIIITFTSTYFAVNRYLKLKSDSLYY